MGEWRRWASAVHVKMSSRNRMADVVMREAMETGELAWTATGDTLVFACVDTGVVEVFDCKVRRSYVRGR